MKNRKSLCWVQIDADGTISSGSEKGDGEKLSIFITKLGQATRIEIYQDTEIPGGELTAKEEAEREEQRQKNEVYNYS